MIDTGYTWVELTEEGFTLVRALERWPLPTIAQQKLPAKERTAKVSFIFKTGPGLHVKPDDQL